MARAGFSKGIAVAAVVVLVVVGLGLASRAILRMGRQPDGAFLVSTGQRIEGGSIAFNGRPSDLALHPSGAFLAVLNKSGVFLVDPVKGAVGPEVKLHSASAGFRGVAWSPDGSRLFASTDKGYIQELAYKEGKLTLGEPLYLQDRSIKGNPVPGGLAITRGGQPQRHRRDRSDDPRRGSILPG
jgi:hypothetical protein